MYFIAVMLDMWRICPGRDGYSIPGGVEISVFHRHCVRHVEDLSGKRRIQYSWGG